MSIFTNYRNKRFEKMADDLRQYDDYSLNLMLAREKVIQNKKGYECFGFAALVYGFATLVVMLAPFIFKGLSDGNLTNFYVMASFPSFPAIASMTMYIKGAMTNIKSRHKISIINMVREENFKKFFDKLAKFDGLLQQVKCMSAQEAAALVVDLLDKEPVESYMETSQLIPSNEADVCLGEYYPGSTKVLNITTLAEPVKVKKLSR